MTSRGLVASWLASDSGEGGCDHIMRCGTAVLRIIDPRTLTMPGWNTSELRKKSTARAASGRLEGARV